MHLSQEVILKVRSKKLEDFQPHFSLIIQPVLFARVPSILDPHRLANLSNVHNVSTYRQLIHLDQILFICNTQRITFQLNIG